MFRSNIINTIIENGKRFINLEIFKGDNHKAKQYNPGGVDYNPPENIEAITAPVNSNNSDNAVIGYRDNVVRTANPGEYIIYSTNSSGDTVKLSLYLKEDGKIEIKNEAGEDLVKLLLDLATATEAITVMTVIGPQPIINKATVTAIKTKIQQFAS